MRIALELTFSPLPPARKPVYIPVTWGGVPLRRREVEVSLMRTKGIAVGSILAFTGVDPAEGQTFLWGNPKDFSLRKGDVVQVLEIHRREGTSWARVIIAVIKGSCVARVGQVSVDLGTKVQRSWQVLTQTGSMAPVRRSAAVRKAISQLPTDPDHPLPATVPDRPNK